MRAGRFFRASLSILALVFLLPIPSAAFASELRCAVCGEAITGKYLEQEGQAYHEGCYAKMKAPRCAVCSEPILGPRVEVDGKIYHAQCYREKVQPHCAVCGRPIEGTYLVEEGKSYHPACHRTRAEKCAICGEPLKGSYLADPWGNPFHARHGRKYLCPFCNRVMTDSTTGGSVVSSANGMRVCRLCDSRGVDRKGRAESLLERTRLRLFDTFPVSADTFTFDLVSKAKLASLLPPGRQQGMELGITLERKARLGRSESIRNDMFLLSGLPDWLFQAVAAHELAHVWQHLQGLEDLPPDKSEGSAELASYLILKLNGSQEARIKLETMERSEDPSYGTGLRRALEVSMNGQAVDRLHGALRGEVGWPDRR
jgi:hypothetical protein